MHIKKIKTFLVLAILGLNIFTGCDEQPPVAIDGNAHLIVIALWDTAGFGNTADFVPLQNAKAIISNEYGIAIHYIDELGRLDLKSVPSSVYGVSVRMPHPEDNNIIVTGSISNLEVISGRIVEDTIMAQPISSSGISINEIYTAGPVNSIFYLFDQYIELYNASDSIKYLDGMMVMRFSSNTDGQGPGADEYGDGSIQGNTYAFKFPGVPGEQNYPFYPKQFMVLASDAMDHRSMVSTSINLSNADWEFYNQFSPNDVDNPNVPNLINMRSDRTSDFLLGLTADVVVLSSGVDSIWADGIKIETIIDGVEFQSNHHPQNKKTLDQRVDRSYVLSPPRYSGLSMKRREPGLDTNNSLDDFLPDHSAPTPGYH